MWPPDPRCLTLYPLPTLSSDAPRSVLSCPAQTLDAPRCPSNVLGRRPRGGPGPAGDAPPPQASPQRSARLPAVPSAHPRGPPTEEEKETLPRDRNDGNPVRGMAPPFGSGRNRGRGQAALPIQRKIQGKECPEAGQRPPGFGRAGTPGPQQATPRPPGDKDCFPGRGPSDIVDPTPSTLTGHRPFKRLEAGIGCAAEVGRWQ